MKNAPKELFERLITAFHSLDLEAVLACFAEDATLYDPHYPVPQMNGKAAIRQGLGWGLSNLEKPGFVLRKLWSDGTSGAAEVETNHLFKGGMRMEFDQVFVFEIEDCLITRLQSYLPHPPGGIGGRLLKITRAIWKLTGKG